MKVKSLLIVYKEKDEEFFKHLKGLIEAKDDGENGAIGTEDGTVRPFKCSEKQWLKHKEKEERIDKLADKFLFIDDIKDVLVPDPVYNNYGISYGPVDRRNYVILIDEKFEWNEELYNQFQNELKRITDVTLAETNAYARGENAKEGLKKKGPFLALGLLFPPALAVAGPMVAKDASDAIKNFNVLRSQMLYFAITKVYLEELDAFMKQ